jgi:uncharacterized protein YodC (DUF2158 family)
MDKLEIGDVVQLKSGGPKMTVEYLPDDLFIKCVWFVRSTLYRGEFKRDLLNKVST